MIGRRTEGAAHRQPRATPSVMMRARFREALKGRINDGPLCVNPRTFESPFQGWVSLSDRHHPGRCPGLCWFAPLGLQVPTHDRRRPEARKAFSDTGPACPEPKKDLFATQKDLFTKEKDLFAKEKDFFPPQKDLFAKEKDLFPPKKDLLAKEKDLFEREEAIA